MRGTSTFPYWWMLAGSFSFSIMAILAHLVNETCEWQVVALCRSSFVFLMVGAYALSRGTKLVYWKPRVLWMRSIAGSISLVCTFYALARLHPSTVLTLTNVFPVWVAVLSWPMLGQLPTARVWAAVVSGVTGVYFIQQPQGDGLQLAMLIAVLASLSTAVAMLGLHRLQGLDSAAIVVHFSFVASLFCIVALFAFPRTPGPEPFWHWQPLSILIGIGIAASVGQVFLTKAFAAGDPSKVSVIGLTQVVFALLFDLSQDHPIDDWTFFGMALIVMPTAWVMRKSG